MQHIPPISLKREAWSSRKTHMRRTGAKQHTKTRDVKAYLLAAATAARLFVGCFSSTLQRGGKRKSERR